MEKSRTILNLISAFSACLVLAVTTTSAQTTAGERDFQVWSETVINVPLVKKKDSKGKEYKDLSLLFIGSIRFGRNKLFPVDERVGIGFDKRINKYVSITPTYIYKYAEQSPGRKDIEHRVRFDTTLSFAYKELSIKDRNRVEYRIRHSRPDTVRYRNRITFKHPVKKDGKTIFSPFVADEVFYDFRDGRFFRNELSLGIERKVTSNFTAEIFYLNRYNTGGLPKYINALGVNFKIEID
ncbi:MAG TPA: DUF2490 domain-containing protein [Pyrinomonadaceae bacterium]|nr:DUF2490 domain-containing protein [Pyrinomonadaceae bacterium]